MARAKKPNAKSGNKPQSAKADAAKTDIAAKTPETPPKSAQTGAVKSDRKVTSTTKPIDLASKDPKSTDPVTPEATDSKPKDVKAAGDVSTKTGDVTNKPSDVPGKAGPDVKKPEPAKSEPVKDPKISAAKPETAQKAIPEKPKDSSNKPVEAKPETKSVDADNVETKKAASISKPPAPVKAVEQAKEPEKSKGGFVPLFFGGLIAGGLGFAAAEMNVLNTRPDIDAIKQSLVEQQEQITAIKPAVLGDLEAGIDKVSETIAGIDTRLAELEERPILVAEDGEALSAEFLTQLETMRTSVEDQRNEVTQLIESAGDLGALKSVVDEQKVEIARLLENALSVEQATADASRDAAIQAASAKLTAAMITGDAYEDVIADLGDAGISDLPAALTDAAADGVATVQSLQTEFPATARAALASARAAGVDAGTGGVGGFLKRQLGARSVSPREGSDPDAVLSRAEASVRAGDVGAALVELDTLPSEVQGAMEGWLTLARARANAEQAVQDLSERLTAN